MAIEGTNPVPNKSIPELGINCGAQVKLSNPTGSTFPQAEKEVSTD